MDSTRGYEPRDKGSIPLWANTSFPKVNVLHMRLLSGYDYRLSPRQQVNGITPL